MKNYIFLCGVNCITIDEDLKNGFEFIPNTKNDEFPCIKITNNKEKISEILSKYNIRDFIGLIEYDYLYNNSNLIAYVEGEYDESQISPKDYLDKHLLLLQMYFFSIWTVKDNAADVDMGYLIVKDGNDVSATSNLLSVTNYTSKGTRESINFSLKDLELAKKFLHENIEIEASFGNFANKQPHSRVTIANYFIQHARSTHDIGFKIISYCSALETLFSNEITELSHRLSERIACFIASEKEDRKFYYKLIKNAYNIRSKVVHGATFKDQKLEEINSVVVEIDSLCRRLTIYSLETPKDNNVFYYENNSFDEYFIDLILS